MSADQEHPFGEAAEDGRLRAFIEMIDEGYCVCEMVLDPAGAPLDYRFLETNARFEEMTGLTDAVGRTALELVPNLESEWIETYASVASGDRPLRFQQESDAMGRWFDVFAAPVEPRGRFALLFRDITERRRADEALEAVAAGDRLWARLGEAIRLEGDPVAIQAAAMRLLAGHLRVDRALYGEVESDDRHFRISTDHAPRGTGSIVGRYVLNDFGPSLVAAAREGETVVIQDSAAVPALSEAERQTFAALGVAATVTVPLVKAGRFVALLSVHSWTPRVWTADEIAVVEGVAERTWAAVERARAEATLRDSEARLRLALEVGELGTWEVDLSTGLGSMDARSIAMVGARGIAPGETFDAAALRDDLVHPDDLGPLRAAVKAGIEAGGSFTLAYRTRDPRGGHRHLVANALVVEDGAGGPRRLTGTNRDVTDQVRARAAAEDAHDRLLRLQQVTAALSGALTPEAVAAVIVEAGAGALGAQAGMVIDHQDGRCRLLDADGYPPHVLERLRSFTTDLDVPVATAITERRPLVIESRADWVARWPAPMSGLGPVALAHPLVSDGKVIGAVAFRFDHDARSFTAREREFLDTLADQCTQALERARLYAGERRVAETLQRRLLPTRLPRHGALEVAVRYRASSEPGEVGGDWYDAIELADGRLGLSIGDVVGRGPDAAAVMGQLRSVLRAYALDDASPARVLDRLARFAADLPGASCATAAYAVLDPENGSLRHACAGHLPPLLIHPDGAATYLAGGRNPPLGVGIGIDREAETVLPDRATCLLYTDGLVERRGEVIDEGLDRLAAAAPRWQGPSLEADLDALLARLVGPGRIADDIAVLAVRRVPGQLRLVVEARPEAASHLRRALRSWPGLHGLPRRVVDDLALAVGEAAANAIEHAYLGQPPGIVELTAHAGPDGRAAVTIRDEGRWREPPAPGDRGRGLEIARSVMDEVHVDRAATGTTVRLTTPASASG